MRICFDAALCGWRRTDEEQQLGDCVLTFDLRQDGNGFHGLDMRQYVDGDRGRIRVRGKADGASGMLRKRGVRVCVRDLQSSSKQDQKNTAQRDWLQQSPYIELAWLTYAASEVHA